MFKKTILLMCIGLFFMLQGYSKAGDAFLKGGLFLRPDGDVDLKYKWRISFGSDYMQWDQLGIGFEIQMSYSSTDILGETIHTIPLNIFINIKYKTATESVRPFGGGGLGMISAMSFDGGSSWDKEFGMHLLGGVELGSLEGSAFVAELQLIKPLSGDNKDTIVAVFGGIKW